MKKFWLALAVVLFSIGLYGFGGQSTSNFGQYYNPAAVAVTGGTMAGVTITNSPISGSSGSFTSLTTSSGYINSQSVVFTPQSGLGSSPSVGCYAGGWTCTPNYGIVGVTVGGTPGTGNQVLISWTTAFNHDAVCSFNAFDNTAGTVLTTLTENNSTPATNSAMIYSPSAFTTAHSLAITYNCL